MPRCRRFRKMIVALSVCCILGMGHARLVGAQQGSNDVDIVYCPFDMYTYSEISIEWLRARKCRFTLARDTKEVKKLLEILGGASIPAVFEEGYVRLIVHDGKLGRTWFVDSGGKMRVSSPEQEFGLTEPAFASLKHLMKELGNRDNCYPSYWESPERFAFESALAAARAAGAYGADEYPHYLISEENDGWQVIFVGPKPRKGDKPVSGYVVIVERESFKVLKEYYLYKDE